MRLAGVFVIAGMALGGCAGEPLWPAKEAPLQAGDDASGPPGAHPESGMPGEAERSQPAQPAAKPQPRPQRMRAPLLVTGITAYDDGKYAEAAKALRAALATRLEKDDQLAAHKYLAFIQCSTGRRNACRDEFRKALRIDPAFELEPAEAGHPVWGPIFRGLKPKPKR